jgi:hypothetical protein
MWLLGFVMNFSFAATATAQVNCSFSKEAAYSCHLKPHDNFHDYKNRAWHSDAPELTAKLENHADCAKLCESIGVEGFCHSLLHTNGDGARRWLCSFQDLEQCNDEPKLDRVSSEINEQRAGLCI